MVGAVVRALAYHQCRLGLIPGLGVMWVEFVVSHSCSERFFSGFSSFPFSSKTNISKFQFNLETEGHRFVSRNRPLNFTLIKQTKVDFI